MHVDLQADNKKETMRAQAKIDGHGKLDGHAQFIEYDVDGFKYVKIIVDVKGDPRILTPGKHAVHIHEKASCDCDDFKCAGGHFDPGPSGNTDPDANHGYHAGDLPNITIDENGIGHLEAITTRITLSDGPVSILNQPDGTSIMIHANPDPHTPGESGSGHSGGPRLGCGSIEEY
jgi:superoxide dismutase, Cu-Zn family